MAFLRQAADKYVEIGDAANEGKSRNNLAITLRKLRRLDEARQEIRREIECKAQFGHASEPWKTWAILAGIETDAGNTTAAAEAKRKAIACYLAYRRDGGENHSPSGRLFHAVTKALQAKQRSEAERVIAEYRETWKHPRTQIGLTSGPPSHRRRQPRPRPRRRPGFALRDGRGNPLPDRDAGEARVAPAPRAGSSTKSPPADRRRLSLMRSPALAYLDMACL